MTEYGGDVQEQGDSIRRAVKVPQNNVKDDQSEAKVQIDVMGEKRCTNQMAWKTLETWPHRLSGARGVAAPVPRTGQCRHDTGKTATMGPKDP